MPPPLHKCACFDCAEMIHKNVVMCREHWRLVSEEGRVKVWATWKEYREARTSEVRIEAGRVYRFAVQDAVKEVADALRPKERKRLRA